MRQSSPADTLPRSSGRGEHHDATRRERPGGRLPPLGFQRGKQVKGVVSSSTTTVRNHKNGSGMGTSPSNPRSAASPVAPGEDDPLSVPPDSHRPPPLLSSSPSTAAIAAPPHGDRQTPPAAASTGPLLREGASLGNGSLLNGMTTTTTITTVSPQRSRAKLRGATMRWIQQDDSALLLSAHHSLSRRPRLQDALSGPVPPPSTPGTLLGFTYPPVAATQLTTSSPHASVSSLSTAPMQPHTSGRSPPLLPSSSAVIRVNNASASSLRCPTEGDGGGSHPPGATYASAVWATTGSVDVVAPLCVGDGAASGRARSHTSPAAAVVREWVESVKEEEPGSAARSMLLVRDLFQHAVLGHPARHFCVEDSVESMTELAARAAVSCVALQEVLRCLPRHESVLAPYVRILMQYVFVPDTPAMREALDGSVRLPTLFSGVLSDERSVVGEGSSGHGRFSARSGADATTDASATTSVIDFAWQSPGSSSEAKEAARSASGPALLSSAHSSSVQQRVHHHTSSGQVARTSATASSVAGLRELLDQYARKPYFLAHVELTRRVVALAHEVRCRELHFQRIPRIFEVTHASWTKTLLRTVVRSWRTLCVVRQAQEQKHRTRWAKRWSTEGVRVSIRRWRSQAAYTLQSAEADTAARTQVRIRKDTIARYRAEVDAMQATGRSLEVAVVAKEEERSRMEVAIALAEVQYKAVLERVRELDRVGTMLINSLLLRDEVPLEKQGARQAAPPAQRGTITLPPSAGNAVAPTALTNALAVLVTWGNAQVRDRGQETEDLCALTEREEEPHDRDDAEVENDETNAPPDRNTGAQPQPPAVAPGGGEAPMESATPQSGATQLATTATTTSASPALLQQSTDALLASTASPPSAVETAFDELLDQSTDVVYVPLYKFLVLMRTFGDKDAGNVPPIDAVRSVKTADAAVRDALQQAQLTADMTEGMEGSDTVLLRLLSETLQKAAQDVADILVDAYERLTGSSSVVTAEQLLTRQRGVLLTFLASLLRYYSNWVLRKQQCDMQELRSAIQSVCASPVHPNSVADGSPFPHTPGLVEGGGGGSAALDAQYLGRRHPRYPEWSHPPANHVQWGRRVAGQKHWVALSFSALHLAMDVVSRPRVVLSLEEQDRAALFTRFITLAQLSDVLPSNPESTTQCFFALVKVLEQHVQKLRFVFQLYAVSRRTVLAAVRARDADVLSSGGDEGEEASAARVTEEDSATAANVVDEQYITSAAFWRLLCDAGVAGQPATAKEVGDTASTVLQHAVPCAVTLHRPLVLAIVEHVLFRPSASCSSSSGATQSRNGRSRLHSPMKSNSYLNGELEEVRVSSSYVSPSAAAAAVPPPLVVAGRRRPFPHIARAVQENRPIDLRQDDGTTCLSMAQFAEALVRCAYAWQCLQATHGDSRHAAECVLDEWPQGGAGPEDSVVSSSGGGATHARDAAASRADSPATSTAEEKAPPLTSGTTAGASGQGGVAKAHRASRAAPKTSHTRGSLAPSRSSFTSLTGAGGPKGETDTAAAGAVRVRYEAVQYTSSIAPVSLDGFLKDWIVPHTLGATQLLSRFRRQARQASVQAVLVPLQEALHGVFARFARPVEATGIRAALPPSVGGGGKGVSGTQQGSSTALPAPSSSSGAVGRPPSFSGSPATAGAAPAAVRDVGIVSVLPMASALQMAQKLNWFRVTSGTADLDDATVAESRLTSEAVAACFQAVLVDHVRERHALFFTEFLDLLCAVACYYDPRPLIPLEAKVSRFVSECVLTDQET